MDYMEKLRCGKPLPPYFAYLRDLQNSLYNQLNNAKYLEYSSQTLEYKNFTASLATPRYSISKFQIKNV